MKDLKHYFSSPKETSKSDLSSASIESLEWCAESRSLNGEGNLKMMLTLKGKKKKKRKPSSAMSDCSSEVAHVVPSSPDTDCKPAKKKRRISYDSLSVLNHKTKIQETDESINNVSIIEDMSSNSLQVDKKRKKRKTESAKSTFTNGTAVQKKKDIPVPRNELEEDVPSINGKRLTQDLNFDRSSICSSGPVVVECSREEPGDNLSKKRLKKGKKSKKKYKVEEDGTGSSGKENCTSNQSPRLDSSLEIGKLTPGIGEAKNKIMNYFNKVDKLVEIPQQRVCVLKVEAIVHSPPTGRPKVGKANPKRKVKMKRRDISAELDLITSEEDSLLENSPTSGAQSGKSWQMRVQLSKPTESG
ncbi:hypothetical protein AAG570_013367 [Ranatra chinensis]|uniref:Uncharacterized protein n=1 Tax=Ranatra chinensis TaxID=642074 RepID=A0ABD0YUH9_9HEMI